MATFTENQPVVIDTYDGPVRGTYQGKCHQKNALSPDGHYLRIRVSETAHGYTEGEVISALPQRVTAVDAPREITDAELDAWETSKFEGERKAAPLLRRLAPADRAKVVAEARAMMNQVPGFRFSGAVWRAARNFPNAPYSDEAKRRALRETIAKRFPVNTVVTFSFEVPGLPEVGTLKQGGIVKVTGPGWVLVHWFGPSTIPPEFFGDHPEAVGGIEKLTVATF